MLMLGVRRARLGIILLLFSLSAIWLIALPPGPGVDRLTAISGEHGFPEYALIDTSGQTLEWVPAVAPERSSARSGILVVRYVRPASLFRRVAASLGLPGGRNIDFVCLRSETVDDVLEFRGSVQLDVEREPVRESTPPDVAPARCLDR